MLKDESVRKAFAVLRVFLDQRVPKLEWNTAQEGYRKYLLREMENVENGKGMLAGIFG